MQLAVWEAYYFFDIKRTAGTSVICCFLRCYLPSQTLLIIKRLHLEDKTTLSSFIQLFSKVCIPKFFCVFRRYKISIVQVDFIFVFQCHKNTPSLLVNNSYYFEDLCALRKPDIYLHRDKNVLFAPLTPVINHLRCLWRFDFSDANTSR